MDVIDLPLHNQVQVYSSILELLCGQLDVLRPGGGAAAAPAAPELAAALKPLDELRAALEARLQVRGSELVATVVCLHVPWKCLASTPVVCAALWLVPVCEARFCAAATALDRG